MLNTTIQIRIDTKTKKQAQKKFQAMGLDLSAGMKLILQQAVADRHLSFAPTTLKNGKLRHWQLYKKEIALAKKHGKRYSSVDELMWDLNAE